MAPTSIPQATRTTVRGFLLTGLLIGLSAPAAAQQRPPAPAIAADRPGAGTGSHVLADGIFQAEGGLAYAESAGTDRYSFGQVLLRYGLPVVEVRAGLNSFVVQRGGAEEEGFEDVTAGIKVPVVREFSFRGALLAGATLPTGTRPFTADDPVFEGSALADWSPSGPASLSLNVGYASRFDGDGGTVSVSATPSLSVPGVEGLGLYAGYAGSFSDGADRDLAEAGLTYLVGSETQVDLNGGFELGSDDFFVGIGIARRVR